MLLQVSGLRRPDLPLSTPYDPKPVPYAPTFNPGVEAVNGEIEQVDRAARGCRNFHHYRIRMLLKTGVLWHTPPTPRIQGRAGQSDAATPAFIA